MLFWEMNIFNILNGFLPIGKVWSMLVFSDHCPCLHVNQWFRTECRGTLGCHLQYLGVPREKTFFNISLKILLKMPLNLKANCYGFATGCRKLLFVGCRKPKKVGKHWRKRCYWNALMSMVPSLCYVTDTIPCFILVYTVCLILNL